MSFNFFQTKLFKVIIIIAISVFFVFLNPGNFFNPVRSVIFSLFSPIQKTFYVLGFEVSQLKDFFLSIGQLKNENEKLLRENREFAAERAYFSEIKRENEILREEMGILPKNDFNLEGASVIGQSIHGQEDWLKIDKGERNGIVQGMPVIVNKGILIGEIKEVYWNTSNIILLSNPKSAVNAIDSNTNSKGIVKGEYGMGIVIDMVLQSESLNKGDEIVTSGIGKKFPKGLLIGRIKEIILSPDRLFQKGVIVSDVDFSRLQFVFVIKDQKQ